MSALWIERERERERVLIFRMQLKAIDEQVGLMSNACSSLSTSPWSTSACIVEVCSTGSVKSIERFRKRSHTVCSIRPVQYTRCVCVRWPAPLMFQLAMRALEHSALLREQLEHSQLFQSQLFFEL